MILDTALEAAMQTQHLNISLTSERTADWHLGQCLFLPLNRTWVKCRRRLTAPQPSDPELKLPGRSGSLGATMIWQGWVTEKRQRAKWNWHGNTRTEALRHVLLTRQRSGKKPSRLRKTPISEQMHAHYIWRSRVTQQRSCGAVESKLSPSEHSSQSLARSCLMFDPKDIKTII